VHEEEPTSPSTRLSNDPAAAIAEKRSPDPERLASMLRVQQVRILADSRANRNVWSAALLQAKNEVTGWSAQMYSAFVEAQSSRP